MLSSFLGREEVFKVQAGSASEVPVGSHLDH